MREVGSFFRYRSTLSFFCLRDIVIWFYFGVELFYVFCFFCFTSFVPRYSQKEPRGSVRRKKHACYRTITAAEFIGLCRTIVYLQQSFRGMDVLQTLMAFNCWHEFFRKPLGKNLRIHPGISLRLVSDRERIHVYIFEASWLRRFPNQNRF